MRPNILFQGFLVEGDGMHLHYTWSEAPWTKYFELPHTTPKDVQECWHRLGSGRPCQWWQLAVSWVWTTWWWWFCKKKWIQSVPNDSLHRLPSNGTIPTYIYKTISWGIARSPRYLWYLDTFSYMTQSMIVDHQSFTDDDELGTTWHLRWPSVGPSRAVSRRPSGFDPWSAETPGQSLWVTLHARRAASYIKASKSLESR